MSENIATLDGVNIDAAPVRARDCSFPITDMLSCIMGDEVLANMLFFIGDWEDNMNVPGIRDQQHDIVIPENLGECDSGTVKTRFESIEFTAPNQVPVSLCTEDLVIRNLKEKFCQRPGRNILQGKALFNADGSFRMGEPYVPNFMRLALGGIENAMAEILGLSALKGDSSETFQFDGLYTQLENGWETAEAALIADPLNVEQVIDWNALTGGTGCASPDDVTIAGQSVTFWGVTKPIPEGLNLAQFLEDLWFDAVELNWTQRHGGVDNWEMHVGWGRARCFLNTASCMQPCDISGEFDPDLRARFAEYRATNFATLYPSGRSFPLLQTKHIDDNVMRLGPSSIGGYPTYAVFLRDYNEILDALAPLRDDIYGTSLGVQWEHDPMMIHRRDLLRENFEAAALYADITKISAKCVQACLQYEAGMLALCRNLWLKIENVCCETLVCDPETGVNIEEQPGPSVPLA